MADVPADRTEILRLLADRAADLARRARADAAALPPGELRDKALALATAADTVAGQAEAASPPVR